MVLAGGALFHQARQLFAAALAGQGPGIREFQAMQFFLIHQGQLGQHPRIDAITLGMFLEVLAQVCNLLAVHQIDRDRVTDQEDRHRTPSHASGLQNRLQLSIGIAFLSHLQQLDHGSGLGPEAEQRTDKATTLIDDHRFVLPFDTQINSNCTHRNISFWKKWIRSGGAERQELPKSTASE